MFRTSNPVLTTLSQVRSAYGQDVMTLESTINKTGILIALVVLGAILTWGLVITGHMAMAFGLGMVGTLGGLGLAIALMFRPMWAATIAPIYALAQGVFMGAISAYFETLYPGVVMQAVGLTVGTLVCMLGVYKTGLIQVTDKFRMGMAAAMGAVLVGYLISFVLSLVGLGGFMNNGIMGLAFSIVLVTLAALNLVLDFDFIVQGVQSRAPKYMEWFGAFGLLVTLIWLYIEILKLLVRLRNQRN